MTVRIGVDATSWTNRRGFGRFTRNVVPRLIEDDPASDFLLYIDAHTARDADLPAGAETRVVQLAEAPSAAAAAGSTRRVSDLVRLAAAVRRDRLDAFLFPSVYTYFPVVGTPTVVGVHDAIVHELPHMTFGSRRDRLAWRMKEALALRTAAAIFTVSEASRRALAERFGLDPATVAVVPEAPDPVFYPRDADAVRAARSSAELGPDEPFLVFAGGVSPHKNVETLVRAFSRLGDGPLRLVVVGDLTRDSYLSAAASVRRLVGELGLGERVLLPGFVDDATLAALYSGATAVVIPSLAEGFGLPAVEGAACGAPMVLSDLPAHRETLDGAALFFEPTDADALAATLDRLLADGAAARSTAQRGLERAAALSWDDAAVALSKVLAAVLDARGRRTGAARGTTPEQPTREQPTQ